MSLLCAEGRGPVVSGKGVSLIIAAARAFPANAALQTQSLFTLRNLTLNLPGTSTCACLNVF